MNSRVYFYIPGMNFTDPHCPICRQIITDPVPCDQHESNCVFTEYCSTRCRDRDRPYHLAEYHFEEHKGIISCCSVGNLLYVVGSTGMHSLQLKPWDVPYPPIRIGKGVHPDYSDQIKNWETQKVRWQGRMMLQNLEYWSDFIYWYNNVTGRVDEVFPPVLADIIMKYIFVNTTPEP